ncbi:MAG: co-chaperone GroES, partial [Planctomycetaceae bacterium]
MKLQPLNDKIVVKREEAEEKTAKGLYLPSAAQEKPRKGKVIALGQGKYLENGTRSTFQVKEGVPGLFSSYAGCEVTLGDVELLSLSE